MTDYSIQTGHLSLPLQQSYITFQESEFCPFVDDIADITMDVYDFIKELIRSILIRLEANTSSIHDYPVHYPTATSTDSLNFLRKINFNDIEKISDFLIKHSDIIYDVLFGCQLATDSFDKNTKFELIIDYDPDMDLEYLTLYVRSKDYDGALLDKIENICDNYWGSMKNKSAYFIITTDFLPQKG